MNVKELIDSVSEAHDANDKIQQEYLEGFKNIISNQKHMITDNPKCLYDLLLIAISQRNTAYVELLYTNFGETVNIATFQAREELSNKYCSPLVFAIEINDINVVKTLLQNGMYDLTDKYSGMNALMTALSRHNLDIAQILLYHGADPNDVEYKLSIPRTKIINRTILDNLKIVKDEYARASSASPNPARNESPITVITNNKLAELFVKIYLKKFGLEMAPEANKNFINQVQRCISSNLPKAKQQMPKVINALKQSKNIELAELHTTHPTKFAKKFVELFSKEIQDEPPHMRTGRR